MDDAPSLPRGRPAVLNGLNLASGHQRAQLLGVDMPIAEAVVALLDGRLRPAEAVAQLMGRGPRVEA